MPVVIKSSLGEKLVYFQEFTTNSQKYIAKSLVYVFLLLGGFNDKEQANVGKFFWEKSGSASR